MEREKLKLYAGKSGQVGAVSAAAACGIRAQVAAEHFRMEYAVGADSADI